MDRSVFATKHGVKLVSKEEIFYNSDIVTIHVPLTPNTRQLVNTRTLDLMHDEAFLINTSRGFVVDQSALKKALINGDIAGAAIDVYEQEPPKDLEFLQLPNLIPTPHISGNSYEAVLAMGRNSIKHIEESLNEFDISVQHMDGKYTPQSTIISDMPI